MLLNLLKPRDRAIFFEYFFIERARFGANKEISQKYNLSRERIRQICNKGLRILRQPRCIECITTYMNSVWMEKIRKFVISNGGYASKPELEKEFADVVTEFYFSGKLGMDFINNSGNLILIIT